MERRLHLISGVRSRRSSKIQLAGTKRGDCRKSCEAQFVRGDVRRSPCKNWCNSQKPKQRVPPSHAHFNTQLGINPNPPNATVLRKDIRKLQSLNQQPTPKPTNSKTQKTATVKTGSNIQKTTTSVNQQNSNVAVKNKTALPVPTPKKEKNYKKPIIIGVSALTLLGIGTAVVMSNN